jgi:hypothetical protein
MLRCIHNKHCLAYSLRPVTRGLKDLVRKRVNPSAWRLSEVNTLERGR